MLWIFASLPLLLLTLGAWYLSGLAIVRNVLRINSGLTVFVLSLPVGMMLNLVLVNAVAHLIFFPISSWIIVIGTIPASLFFLRHPQPPLNWEISIRQRLVLLAALLLLVLGIFYINAREIWGDDPGHASMINLMASGEFPLLFQCNPQIRASYGYGGDLLAAVTQVMGGINSWDAEDVVKAATVASVVMLAFLVGWRHKQKIGAGLLSVFLIFTAAGMLWMYEPLSSAGGRYIAEQTSALSPLPQDLDLLTSDPGHYTIDTPDTPGFASYGYSERSLSWGFAPFVILFFLVMVDTPVPPFTKSVTLGIILAMAALLHPATLSLLFPGFIIYLFFWVRARRRRRFPRLDFNPIWTLVVAFVLMIVQGGQITDTILDKLQGIPNVMTSFMLAPFQLPSCRGETPTVHCALLSVGTMGLVPFLIPVLLWLTWRTYKRPGWAIILLGAIVAMGTTLVTRYAYIDWNIQRLIVFSVWTGAVLLGPVLYEYF
ncbi:MAG TPA: hypothetical protein VKQ72_17945, partial [Aggregatilineales bacterium]|nr:hypothetical protein [Aggregatilineales bacterium]